MVSSLLLFVCPSHHFYTELELYFLIFELYVRWQYNSRLYFNHTFVPLHLSNISNSSLR